MSSNKDISQLHNSEIDKICHVVGHGPSLSRYLDYLSSLDESNIIVSINEIDTFTNLTPDYWLTSNPMYTVEKMYERINRFSDTKFIYSDITDLTDSAVVENLLKVKYFTFDWLHFGGKSNNFFVKDRQFGCDRAWIPCCQQIQNRLTIQELLMKITGFDNHYSTGDTNIIHALALSIILGCKEINLYGVDLDYSKGYVGGHQTNSNGATHGDSFEFWMDRIKSDFYIIKKSADIIGTRINYKGDSNLLRDIFEKSIIPQKVYRSDCKHYD